MAARGGRLRWAGLRKAPLDGHGWGPMREGLSWMATLAAGEISNVAAAAAELLTVRWLLETSATGCWKKKNVNRKFSAVVSAICAQNVLQEYLLFGQVLRWQIRIQVKAGLHPKLVWLAKDTRFLWGVVLLSVVVVRVCVCLVVTVIFGVFQACHVAQGSSETGAQEPPDDGGRVEGNWCPAEPGMDSLHDPPARWVTSSGASPLTAYVT